MRGISVLHVRPSESTGFIAMRLDARIRTCSSLWNALGVGEPSKLKREGRDSAPRVVLRVIAHNVHPDGLTNREEKER